MSKVSTNISIDADVKAKAQKVLAAMGLDLSTAVGVFLRQVVMESRIPFEIKAKIPNDVTITALKEFEEMEKHPERYKSYNDVDQMMEDILSEV